jgi:ParB family transcriptional regulator, chromosome partitioning protein
MTDPFENQTQNMNLNKGRQSTRMIWPGHLRMPRFSERIDPGSDIDGLINSIREYGQKVPILVRRLPDGELEIVYGVRRVLACIALGYEVRAMVTEMSDKEALITRGIENNERVTSRRSESHPNENFVDEFSKARSTVPPDLDIET